MAAKQLVPWLIECMQATLGMTPAALRLSLKPPPSFINEGHDAALLDAYIYAAPSLTATLAPSAPLSVAQPIAAQSVVAIHAHDGVSAQCCVPTTTISGEVPDNGAQAQQVAAAQVPMGYAQHAASASQPSMSAGQPGQPSAGLPASIAAMSTVPSSMLHQAGASTANGAPILMLEQYLMADFTPAIEAPAIALEAPPMDQSSADAMGGAGAMAMAGSADVSQHAQQQQQQQQLS
jgi:hypothetical protein